MLLAFRPVRVLAPEPHITSSAARLILVGILAVYLACGLLVALGTPPWEANDEPDHLRNVESLVAGEMYRIGPNGGLESHQPPLYYAVLATYQRALGFGVHDTRPAYATTGGPELGLWDHDTSSDGDAQRFVSIMRLSSLAMGAGVIVFAYLTTRLVVSSRATALIAAATVATLPKFVFLSSVVNSDNLVNLIAAAVVYLSVRSLTVDHPSSRQVRRFAIGLGLLVGLSLATKLTAVAIVLPALFAVARLARRSGQFRVTIPLFALLCTIPSLPWIIFTAREYDDPFAGRVSGEYFDAVIPGLMRKHVTADVYFTELPTGLWRTFWYSSGWNQYFWSDVAYLPFWLLLVPAVVWGGRAMWRRHEHRDLLVAFALTIMAALLVFVYIGTITTGTQARVTFVGLVAVAVVASVGTQRLPVLARCALPVVSLVGTLIAIRSDVIHLFVNR